QFHAVQRHFPVVQRQFLVVQRQFPLQRREFAAQEIGFAMQQNRTVRKLLNPGTNGWVFAVEQSEFAANQIEFVAQQAQRNAKKDLLPFENKTTESRIRNAVISSFKVTRKPIFELRIPTNRNDQVVPAVGLIQRQRTGKRRVVFDEL